MQTSSSTTYGEEDYNGETYRGPRRCHHCGKTFFRNASHSFKGEVRLAREHVPALVGRSGLTIQELSRRCAACISIRSFGRRSAATKTGFVCLTVFCSSRAAFEAIVQSVHQLITLKHIERKARRNRLETLSHRVGPKHLTPCEVLLGRPSGHWRLPAGQSTLQLLSRHTSASGAAPQGGAAHLPVLSHARHEIRKTATSTNTSAAPKRRYLGSLSWQSIEFAVVSCLNHRKAVNFECQLRRPTLLI